MTRLGRPRRRLRTRLLVAIVLVAFGVLVVSATGAAVLSRRSAESSALHAARRAAPRIGGLVADFATQVRDQPVTTAAARRLRSTLGGLLAASGSRVFSVTPDGRVIEGAGRLFGHSAPPAPGQATPPPPDLRNGDLDLVALAAGTRQSGVAGSDAFAAVPLPVVAGATPVVYVTRAIERRPLGGATGYFIVTGAVTLAVAAAVASWLARRLTRPIAAMEQTANAIAGGDLSARVDLGRHPDDELARLARSLDAMAAQLEAARGHERAFLLSVSHDLRTPLTSIRGYAEAIVDGTVRGETATADAARVVTTEAKRLERLVADLLDLARLDAHSYSLTPVPVDAREVVERTITGFAPAARAWGLGLEVLPGEPVAADLDPDRLAQVVANLVENALKFASTSVVVSVQGTEGSVDVRVDDDGPGIPVDAHERVFERLYTARGANGRSVGTGIGLAIVAELATAMGGTATSGVPDDGRGARFTVRVRR
ncbi:MAG: HAMP domain-containing sensor histidine kinase [Actinomycetes bacterium]